MWLKSDISNTLQKIMKNIEDIKEDIWNKLEIEQSQLELYKKLYDNFKCYQIWERDEEDKREYLTLRVQMNSENGSIEDVVNQLEKSGIGLGQINTGRSYKKECDYKNGRYKAYAIYDKCLIELLASDGINWNQYEFQHSPEISSYRTKIKIDVRGQIKDENIGFI